MTLYQMTWQPLAGRQCPASDSPPVVPHHLYVGESEAVSRGCGSTGQGSHLEWVHHTDIQGGISPSSPVWDEHISRAAVSACEEEPALLVGTWPSYPCRLESCVSEVVVATDSLPFCPAEQGMISGGVTGAEAGQNMIGCILKFSLYYIQ